ncbi:MAG: NAD(P)-binding domain-containing protein [Anaerolineales bacterium]|nr:NAD(P)-binding domain-containing protein [Anaerolineales bacterium]
MSDSPIEVNTIIIGAGPAGLSVGACLKQAGIQAVILEQSDKVGSVWRGHYDRLHLHTDKRNSELPFESFPKDYPRYPSRDQLIDYLDSYAKKFDLDIQFNQQVKSARRDNNNQWEVQTQDVQYLASNLVIAAGNAREKFIPKWKGQDSFAGKIIHSSEYKNGEEFKGQNVLVVGFGNSGGEIAIDLFEHGAKPSISVRSAVNVIPRELFGIPILSIGIVQNVMPAWMADAMNKPILRAVIGDITKYGLRKLPYGPATQIQNDKHIPLIDVGTIKLIKQGHITVHSGVEEFRENRVKFTDGKEANFDSVILATGYRPRVNEFLNEANVQDENGTPESSGCEASVSGLYFCGYYVSPTGMLREIAIEAKQIAAAIVKKSKLGV